MPDAPSMVFQKLCFCLAKKSSLLVKIENKCLFVVLDAPANMSGKEYFKMLRTSQKARS